MNAQATVAIGNGVIRIPMAARVEIIATPAKKESTSRALGRNAHKRWRPRN